MGGKTKRVAGALPVSRLKRRACRNSQTNRVRFRQHAPWGRERASATTPYARQKGRKLRQAGLRAGKRGRFRIDFPYGKENKRGQEALPLPSGKCISRVKHVSNDRLRGCVFVSGPHLKSIPGVSWVRKHARVRYPKRPMT